MLIAPTEWLAPNIHAQPERREKISGKTSVNEFEKKARIRG